MSFSAGLAGGARGAQSAIETLLPGLELPEQPAPQSPTQSGARTPAQQRQASSEAGRRQRKTAQSARGFSDTILTGPLGLVGEPSTRRASLLGT